MSSCYEMCCLETLESDEWEETNTECTDKYYIDWGIAEVIPDIFEGFPERESSGLLQRLLATYSTGELSYDAVTLNAVRGVFRTTNALHCWGQKTSLAGRGHL
jgi:hypothetical protein